MAQRAAAKASIEEELDRRLFYLKTLYDMSCGLFGMLDLPAILRKFLFMTSGTFGVMEGFLMLAEVASGESTDIVSLGFSEEEKPLLVESAEELMRCCKGEGKALTHAECGAYGTVPPRTTVVVPFNVNEQCRGLVGLGEKMTGEAYSIGDEDLLVTLVNNLVIAVRNAQHAAQLKDAYEEVSSLNRAKDKVINHLSHELKTPLSLLKATLIVLERRLGPYPEEVWLKTLRRAQKNVDRLSDMQEEVDDIMRGKSVTVYRTLNLLLDQCGEELALLAADETGEERFVERVRERIEVLFGPRDQPCETIRLDRITADIIEAVLSRCAQRKVLIESSLNAVPPLFLPRDVVTKIINGLLKNAVENTPDGGRIEVATKHVGDDVHFIVHDHGVGIAEEHRKHIFEGFFPTQETDAYRSGHPFDFNAGGKGADLLRMKIFSERFHFRLDMESERCPHIPGENDVCPGSVDRCEACVSADECAGSGGTVFTVIFPVSEAEVP